MDQVILIADIVLIVLMGAAFVYGARLSKSIKVFTSARSEMHKLVLDISGHVTQAENAIQDMKKNAQGAGKALQSRIDAASSLSEELQFITETADNLAQRLEDISEGRSTEPKARPQKNVRAKEQKEAPKGASALFTIRDPEFEQNLKEDPKVEPWEGPEELETKAERELYNALKSKKVHN